MDLIDMHTHTTYSDGTLNPKQLIDLAKTNKLRAIAITDHDTINALDECFMYGYKEGIEVIAGIELNSYYNNIEIHLLGYFFDYNGQFFKNNIKKFEDIRYNRNVELINKINSIGIDIDDIENIFKSTPLNKITRMHFARLIFEKGFTNSIKESFDKYLNPGKIAYVGRDALDFVECIDFLKKSGGVCSIAHPYSYGLITEEVIIMIRKLAENGLDAIEAIYSSHTIEQEKTLINLSKEIGLKITGGSDFHGDNKPGINIGFGYGNLKIPYKIMENLRN